MKPYLIGGLIGSLLAIGLAGAQTIGPPPSGGSVSIAPLQIIDANTVVQRNSTNAQFWKIYNTYTDASNGEWLEAQWNTNTMYLRTQHNGTGSARDLYFSTEGVMSINGDAYVNLRVTGATALRINSNGATVQTGYSLQLSATTVASLPGSPALGMMMVVTDALAPAVGAAVSAGGSAKALVWYNGTQWTVMGI